MKVYTEVADAKEMCELSCTNFVQEITVLGLRYLKVRSLYFTDRN